MKTLLLFVSFFIWLHSNAQTLYGFSQNTFPDYYNNAFTDTIKSLQPDIIRYPGGKITGDFDWKAVKKPTLASLAYMRKKVGCDILFVLNMNSSTLNYQMQMLDSAAALGIPIKYVEFGNEVNNSNNPLRKKFKSSGAEYGKMCKNWANAIKKKYPKVKFGAWGENKPDLPHWNKQLLSVYKPDAVVSHLYPVEKIIAVKGVIDYDFFDHWIEKSFVRSGIDFSVPVWITEYNLDPDGLKFLKKGQQKPGLIFMTNKLADMGVQMLIMHSLAQGDNGAMQVENNGKVYLRATGEAFKEVKKHKPKNLEEQIPIAYNYK